MEIRGIVTVDLPFRLEALSLFSPAAKRDCSFRTGDLGTSAGGGGGGATGSAFLILGLGAQMFVILILLCNVETVQMIDHLTDTH